jgi:hypothetical protein
MDIILNVAVGGTMGGVVPDSNFAYTMEVDYVRVFQDGSTFEAGAVLSALENSDNPTLLQSVAEASVARSSLDLDSVKAQVSSAQIATLEGVNALLTDTSSGAIPRLATASIDLMDLDEDLVDALASADIDLGALNSGVRLQVTAQADSQATDWLQASLLDMQQVGIDQVIMPMGLDGVVVSLRDAGDISNLPDLGQLPFFVHQADQSVTLLVDGNDLDALLNAATSLQTLAAKGVTLLQPDNLVTDEALANLAVAYPALPVTLLNSSTPTSTELDLLGLGIPPENPFGLVPL